MGYLVWGDKSLVIANGVKQSGFFIWSVGVKRINLGSVSLRVWRSNLDLMQLGCPCCTRAKAGPWPFSAERRPDQALSGWRWV